MVFRRKGSVKGRKGNDRGQMWYTWPTLPHFGRIGPLATGATTKAQSERIENWLKEAALERPQLIRGLLEKRYDLPELWVAKQLDQLDELLLQAKDPLLSAAATAFAEVSKDARVKDGLGHLAELADQVEKRRAEAEERRAPAPGSLRLSWLRVPTNVTELYDVAEKRGMSAGSVRRSIHRAVADLLAHHFGKAKRNAVMVDVAKPQANDEREVRITPGEIQRLLDAFDPEFRDMVALAILLGVDQAPLTLITPRFFHEEVGTLEVLDRKTASRPRTIELSTPALVILRRRCSGHGLDEPVFPFTQWQVRHRWEEGRNRAAGRPSRNQLVPRGRKKNLPPAPDPVGEVAERLLEEKGIVTLPVLRFKDLRHLVPTAWNALRLPSEDLSGIMGWAKGSNMGERYTTARIQGDRENLDQVAAFLGLDRYHLKASGE